MIWHPGQQHRFMVFVGGLDMILLVPFLIMTGLDVSQEARAAIACVPPPDDTNLCLRTFETLVHESPVPLVLSSLPLLVGAFIGAPLVSRELEQGTYLLAWTQGVPRRRWLIAKLAMLGGLSVLGFAALAGLMAWWSSCNCAPISCRRSSLSRTARAPLGGACWCRRTPSTCLCCFSRSIDSGSFRGSKRPSSWRWPWRCSCSLCGGCAIALREWRPSNRASPASAPECASHKCCRPSSVQTQLD